MAKSMVHIEIGQPMKLEFNERYFQFNRQNAIRDVFDAIVELITNSDDSYHRMYLAGQTKADGGPIFVEYMDQRGGKPSILRVRDRAEGMTLHEMVEKLGNVGVRRSGEGDRGFMARGAKDCTELGTMNVESIKNGKYYACELTPSADLIPLNDGNHASSQLKSSLGIRRNGTVVSLQVDSHHRMPRITTILKDLPWHFALRDILSKTSHTRVQVQNLNHPESPKEPLIFHLPEGEPLLEASKFDVPGYPDANAYLTIYRAPESFKDSGDRRFRRAGFIIKGKRAIHECSLLIPEFESDPYAHKYFGRIDCEFIDELLDEYDDFRSNSIPFPDENPRLLIDANRQQGLVRAHPFAQALLQVPSEKLRAFIAKDREAERAHRREIANNQTKRRLERLAKIAGSFMKEQLDELEDISSAIDVDADAFAKRGVLLVPTYAKLKVGDEKKFYMYAKRSLIPSGEALVVVENDTDDIGLIEDNFRLLPHSAKEDRLVGTFRVRALSPSDGVYIRAKSVGLPDAEGIIEIAEPGFEVRDFSDVLEFEHTNYTVRQGANRSLNLYALFPDLVSMETKPKVWAEDNDVAVVKKTTSLIPVSDSNFARAKITVNGRRLKGKTAIHASANGRQATCNLRVVQKEEKGVPIIIELRDEDFSNFRAIWADHESQPNLLLISALHDSIRRYLGPPPEFEGQNSPIFHLLLAEIVAESVCRKVLRMDAQEHPWDYNLADFKDDVLIVDTVMAKLHSKIRDFVAQAHSIMLSDQELDALK